MQMKWPATAHPAGLCRSLQSPSPPKRPSHRVSNNQGYLTDKPKRAFLKTLVVVNKSTVLEAWEGCSIS